MLNNSSSLSPTETRSSAPLDTDSTLRTDDGSPFATSVVQTKLLPSGVELWQLSKPVKHGRRMVLSYRDFVRLYLKASTSQTQFRGLGVPAYVVPNSVAFYGTAAETIKRRVQAISRETMTGNKFGSLSHTKATLRKEQAEMLGQQALREKTLKSGLRVLHMLQSVRDGRHTVLHREDYQRHYLDEARSVAWFQANGVLRNTLLNSVAHYGLTEGQAAVRKKRVVSKAAQGNTAGQTTTPKVLVARQKLETMLASGMTTWAMAEALGMSHYLIRRNLVHYGLEDKGGALKSVKQDFLGILEPLSPGLGEAFLGSAASPETFTNLLYIAHLRLIELQHASRGIRAYARGRAKHISFSSNTAEALVALQLLALGVGHTRHHRVHTAAGCRAVDFFIPKLNAVLEIDGTIHELPDNTEADMIMTASLIKAGYKVVRLTAHSVLKDAATEVARALESLK